MNAPDAIGTARELRDVPGFGGLYAVTADGRVWAKPRAWRTGAQCQVQRSHAGKWMAQRIDSRGYIDVGLTFDRKATRVHVHRLVALAWISNPLGLPQVNHINALKGDNRVVNLEWCTAKENKRHAHALGLCPVTECFRESVRRNVVKAQAATRKLTYEQADQARASVAAGAMKTRVAKSLGISFSTLDSLLKGKTYATK